MTARDDELLFEGLKVDYGLGSFVHGTSARHLGIVASREITETGEPIAKRLIDCGRAARAWICLIGGPAGKAVGDIRSKAYGSDRRLAGWGRPSFSLYYRD